MMFDIDSCYPKRVVRMYTFDLTKNTFIKALTPGCILFY